MPLNFGGEPSSSSSSSNISVQQIKQQLQPYFIERSGDTINATSDSITTVPNPVNPQDPVNLQYIQNYVASNSVTYTQANSSYLRLDGTNNPSSNISMNNNRLTNLSNPASVTDAAPLSYINNSSGYSFMTINTTNYPSNYINFSNFTSATGVTNLGTTALSLVLSYSNSAPNNNNLPSLSSLNNIPTLSFTGIGNGLLSTGAAVTVNYGSTYIALVYPTAISSTSLQQRFITFSNSISIGLNNLNPNLSILGHGEFYAYPISLTPNTWSIVVYRLNTNGSVDFAINGNSTYVNGAGLGPTLGVNSGINLGCYASTIQMFVGQIAGVWCFNTAFTNSQIDIAVGEICWNYNVQSILPSTHTYKNNRPWIRLTNVDLNSNRLINVANPINSQDASTMAYNINTAGVAPLTIQQFTPIIYLDSFTANNNIVNNGSLACIFSGSALPTFTANALNGLGILTFDGLTTILNGNVTDLIQAPSTFIAVVRANNTTGKRTIFDINNDVGIAINTGALFFREYSVQNYTTVTTTITVNSWTIIVYRFNANFSVDFAINGSPTYETITGTSNVVNIGTNTITFGSGNTQFWSGDIAGVYVLPAALTNPQVDQFVGLLAYQFGLTSLLPSTHTYKVFPPLARNTVLNMNNYGITAIPTNTTDVTGAINLSQLNSAVNTLCGVSNNTPKACITADGTISMSGNLNLNSNKVVSLATPTNTTDAANKTYVDTAVGNLFVGLFAQTIGPETTSTSTTSSQVQKTFTITNSLFTSLTILHPVIIVYNQSSTNYTDAFVGTVRSMSLSGTTLTLNINVTRIDVSGVGTWGESPTCDILVFIR